MPTIKKYQERDPYQNYLQKTSRAESGGNPNAKASTSSALGKYQFLEGTWKAVVDKYNLGYSLDDRTDPVKSEKVMRLFTKDNEQQLKPILGRDLTDSERYLGHFLGVGGASNLFKASKKDQNMPVSYYLSPKIIEANRSVFYNKDGSIKTTKQVYDWADKKMGTKSTFAKDVAPYMNIQQTENISYLPQTELNSTFTPSVNIDYLKNIEEQKQQETQTTEEQYTPQENAFMQDILSSLAQGVEYVKPIQRDIMESGGKIPVSPYGVFASGDKTVIVPSPNISMKNVNYPIQATSIETGEVKMLKPNEEYFFKNTKNVLEVPIK